MRFSCLSCFSTLNMERIYYSETSVNYDRTRRSYISEDGTIHHITVWKLTVLRELPYIRLMNLRWVWREEIHVWFRTFQKKFTIWLKSDAKLIKLRMTVSRFHSRCLILHMGGPRYLKMNSSSMVNRYLNIWYTNLRISLSWSYAIMLLKWLHKPSHIMYFLLNARRIQLYSRYLYILWFSKSYADWIISAQILYDFLGYKTWRGHKIQCPWQLCVFRVRNSFSGYGIQFISEILRPFGYEHG